MRRRRPTAFPSRNCSRTSVSLMIATGGESGVSVGEQSRPASSGTHRPEKIGRDRPHLAGRCMALRGNGPIGP
jgi:hypothetical protein